MDQTADAPPEASVKQTAAFVCDFAAVMARVNRIISDIAPHDSVERYQGLGVDVVKGRACIEDPWRVRIDQNDGGTHTLTTRSIIVATGSVPIVPNIEGLDGVNSQTSDTLWDYLSTLSEVPKRIAVLGGGPIGCELSQAFARLGAKVTQIEKHERLLGREDEPVSRFVETALRADGVEVITCHQAVRCEQVAGQSRLVVRRVSDCGSAVKQTAATSAATEQAIDFDMLLLSIGRRPRLSGYGLDNLGLIDKDTQLPTDEAPLTDAFLQTRFANIYMAGDVSGSYQFTHTAAHQAWFAAVNALFGTFKRFKVDNRVIPWTTFVDPEVARVGLNEQDARAQHIDYEVTQYDLAELDRAITDAATDANTAGWVTVLTVPDKDKILGVTIVGRHASDMLAEYVLAMKQGLGLNKILGTTHTYPTMSEANKYAAGEWKRNHAPEGLLNWVKKYHDWRRR